MMKSAFWRAGALALVAVLVLPTIVPGLAFATEARHTALNGSLLHSTSAELNAYPHMAADMNGFAEITSGLYPSDSSSGTGRILFNVGESLKLHLQANDNGFPARGIDYMWGGTSSSSAGVFSFFDTPAQVLDMDLVGGTETLAWAAGIGLAQTKDEEELSDGTTDTTEKHNLTGFALRASVGNDQFDAGAEIAKIGQTDEFTGFGDPTDGKTEPGETVFGAYGQLKQENWQFIGALAVDSFDSDADGADDPSFLAILGAAGYHFRNDDTGHVTGQLHIEYLKANDVFVADDNALVDFTDIYVPGFEVAVDHKVSDRFRVYVGADASYVMSKAEGVDVVDPDVTGTFKSSEFVFDWTAGLGFAIFENVQLDFVFNTSNLDQLLSLGNEDPLIAQFSANVAY